MSIISYKLINNVDVEMVDGVLLYKSKDFYIQTPVMISSEIINCDNDNYIQLNFVDIPTHNLFISNLKNIETKILGESVKFETLFLRDIHNNISLRVRIDSLGNTFFNKDKISILGSEIFKKTRCLALIYLNSKYEWKLFQYMKL